MDSEHKVNGSHVVKTRAWIDGHLGPGKFHVLARQRDPEWPEGIRPSIWYDIYPMAHAIERAVVEVGMSVGAWVGFLPVGIELAGGSAVRAEIAERGPEEGSPDTSWLRCVARYE